MDKNQKKLLDYFGGDELAANVWKSKYAAEGEETPEDMHRRMAKEFYRVDKGYQQNEDKSNVNLSKYGKEREDFTEESIFNLFDRFKYIVPQGSVMYGAGREGTFVSLSNCFFIGQPEDSYAGILEKDEQLVQLMKRRAGVGMDISSLRPRGQSVTNSAGSSSGAASFMERFSNSTRECGQDGRRGALLLSIDVRHPDVEEFIDMKSDLTKVTGANVSVKITDEFMECVEKDENFTLRFPIDYDDPIYTIDIKAKKLWNFIVKKARDNSEPGLLLWDNIINNSPDGVYEEFKPQGVNPCGEILLQNMDSCRLMLVNLYSFVKNAFSDSSKIDFDLLYRVSYENQRLMDNLIDLELEAVEGIISKVSKDDSDLKYREIGMWKEIQEVARRGRRTGSGLTALGDMIAAIGLPYDSDEALSIVDKVMETKMRAELDATIDLAILRGAFPGWNPDLEYKVDGDDLICGNRFYEMLKEKFPSQMTRMIANGRRNVSVSTIAPAGSVSILTQTTSGCEPLFMPFYKRRKKLNHNDTDNRVDFIDDLGDKWQEYFVLHPKFKDWINVNFDKLGMSGFEDLNGLSEKDLQKYFEKSPWYKSTANDIDWIKRVEMQSILQRYVTHSISSTLNLPEDVTYEEVNDIYMESWKRGLKGVTIYRDGSRSGVLVTNKDKYERPDKLDCAIHHTTSMGSKYTILIGFKDDKPFEIFCIPANMATSYKEGSLVKEGGGSYTLYCGDNEKFGVFKNITDKMTPDQQNLTRAWSLLLKSGVPVHKIVEQIEKTTDPITGFSKAVARVLGSYIPDGTKSALSCIECGSKNVVFEEGCSKCLDCGSSACG